ncbi:DUF6705 family protein [Flavobacterium humi]|uniref:DUF6705 domain-containing protein n=1 Tax=Flavobacterium humi TaxID=2562683 RepID=A0A4Z0LC71_9FLAO|nr:DUF6705 family protein [Flavobacterium humi]TGD59486.1 hypothetical protein E4635_00700 [Flavobacterium humi]
MKNILKIAIILYAFQINAQTVKPAEQFLTPEFLKMDNVYFKDVNHVFDKFLGTWEYSNGPYYLKVIITKITKQEQGISNGKRMRTRKHFFDLINCDYIYKYNGVTVYNVIPPYQVVNDSVIASSIDGHLINNTNQVELSYNEPSTTTCIRNRFGELKLTYITGAIPKLQWLRTDKLTSWPESYCTNGQFDISEYKIPANLVLTKI